MTRVVGSKISVMKKTIALLLIVVLSVIIVFPRVTSAGHDGQRAQSHDHQSDDQDHGEHDNHSSHEGQSGMMTIARTRPSMKRQSSRSGLEARNSCLPSTRQHSEGQRSNLARMEQR